MTRHMIRPLVVVALLVGLAACALKVAPAAKKSAFDNIQVVKSPGGVTAWLVEEHAVPVIAMRMAWKGGTTSELPGKDGVGWVLGYMMNEGAGDMDTQAYGARMEDLNMSFGCEIGADWSGCSLGALAEKQAESFDMVRLALANPRFDEEPITRAKRELSVSIEEGDTDPGTILARNMAKAVYPDHVYARYATLASAASVTRDDIAAMKTNLMARDNLRVVVVGPISAAQLGPELDKMFGALPEKSNMTEAPDVTPLPAPAEPVVIKLPIAQTAVSFNGPGIKRDDPDFYPGYVLNYILGGGGFASRLMDDIREKRGLTYGISTGLGSSKHLWRWTGGASTKHATANEMVKLIKENIDRLGTEGPTQQELDDAKAFLTGAFPMAFDTNAKMASSLMGFWQDDLGPEYVADRNGLIEKVTLEDLKRVAAKYMKSKDFTFVMVGLPE